MGNYKIIAATGCPTGIAHTFRAQEALEAAAKKAGVSIKVETHGQIGVENELTNEDIRHAEAVIIAADKDVHAERFAGKRVIEVSVSAGIKEADHLIKDALAGKGKIKDGTATSENTSTAPDVSKIGHSIYKNLMNGVSHMLPFVVAGGVLIAISFAVWGIHSAEPDHATYNATAAMIKDIGGQAMGMMVPILSAFIAESIAKRPALVAGLIGGIVANAGGAGFLGGILSGFLAGYLILFLQKLLRKMPKSLDGLKAVFILPVLGVAIVGIAMYLLAAPMEAINQAMMNFLAGFENSNPIVLGLIVGSMCAFDMGGPVNKAAYVTGTALLAQGNYSFMAGVSAACIAPPLITSVATLVFRKYYNTEERNAGIVNLILGSTHITEGAIPFAAKNPLIILPIFMVGSSIASILTYLFGVKVPAPHGGFLVLPVVTGAFQWVLSILIGSAVGGILLGLYQKRRWEKEKRENKELATEEILAPSAFLSENDVFLHQTFNTRDEMFDFLAEKTIQRGIATHKEEIKEKLVARELEGTTGMMDGFAIPHAKSSNINKASLIIVKNEKGIAWDSLDGQPITFIIGLFIPEHQKGTAHLQLLSSVAKMLMIPAVIDQLKAANSQAEIVSIINQKLVENSEEASESLVYAGV
ncbi:fructose-specific PTS transporter subunit EIIC [Lactococcus petauri]|uniref:Fructose-specific PTS transporter subunit EIIC n=1 Tax=Lactococcus petauri TaxID=1940789 RepID=A0AAJ2J0I9_9LACT|nr:fructose-specific PTS transporter subunit EIIC [Lactococcus petauri]MDT2527820.1 fructose-specific PTS transporter subunit EIIC [Lactococcus petauri]MDT2542364.1 fructose-specific PTS transporter subunit EIIC [Lactococcus petauri]MDT2558863.1 fructose-specific PTS transporter subunit EIIC [Lactococcus petauri]MDT2561072.1 fructose-specific PTS transporter subunit EIIC [Lactococcus petauri]MDT2569545.1 fructose-specific PTS transporter subunit EIIC [Lactococcus petauri]